jgi:hypothetical protein
VTPPVQAANRPIRVCVIGTPSALTAHLPPALEALTPGIEVSWTAALSPTSTARLGSASLAMSPHVLVVLQEHPEDASPAQVRALLNTFALARLIVCCSPWCDSAGRTRDLWPAACRVPADLLLYRLHRELACVRGILPPLPLTADRDECWEFDFAAAPTPGGRSLAVAVDSPDPAVAEWLCDALTAMDYRFVEPFDATADVLLYDADPWNAQRAASLAAIQRTHHGLPMVALAGYPRASVQRSLLEAGVSGVVAKLSVLSQLSRALEDATVAAPHSRRPDLHIHAQT